MIATAASMEEPAPHRSGPVQRPLCFRWARSFVVARAPPGQQVTQRVPRYLWPREQVFHPLLVDFVAVGGMSISGRGLTCSGVLKTQVHSRARRAEALAVLRAPLPEARDDARALRVRRAPVRDAAWVARAELAVRVRPWARRGAGLAAPSCLPRSAPAPSDALSAAMRSVIGARSAAGGAVISPPLALLAISLRTRALTSSL